MIKSRVCVTIPPEVLRAADALAAVERRSRSWLVTEAVAAFTAPSPPSGDAPQGPPAPAADQSWVMAFDRYADYRSWKEREAGTNSAEPFRARLAELCATLERRKVRYLLIGSAALRLLGASRVHAGMELLIPRSAKNARRALAALARMKATFASEALAEGVVARAATVFGEAPRADLLTRAGSVRYKDAKERAAVVRIEGADVRVAASGDVSESTRSGDGVQTRLL
jgi:hypothetical protein